MPYFPPLHSGVLRLIMTKRCLLKMYVFLLYRTNTQRLLMERNIFAQEVYVKSVCSVLMDMPVMFSLIMFTLFPCYISYRLCSVLLNYIVHILCFVRLYRLCFNIPPNCGRSYHWRCRKWSVVLHQDIFGQEEKGALNNICNNLWWDWPSIAAIN